MPSPSPNADVYTWIGASGGLWGFAANWRDLTSGASPASYIPGALTPVTIAGPAGLTYAAIGGGGSSASGNSASLAITGNIALGGAYGTGALILGARSIAGAGSSSVSYVYAAGALVVATSLSAGTISLVSGSLGLLGAGATVNAAGAISLGEQSITGGPLPASYDPGASASINVTAGTALTAAGALSVTQGSVSVSGSGASISVAGPVSLGAAGVPPGAAAVSSVDAAGAIAIGSGGSFVVGGALTEFTGSIGVNGAGSRLTVQTILTLGAAAAAGSLSVTGGGAVQAGGIAVQAPATSNPGSAGTFPAAISVDAASSIEIGSAVAAAGTITIDAGKSLTATADVSIIGNVVDNGTLSEAGGSLTLTGNLSGTGVLQIGHNGSVTVNGAVAASDSIVFADATGTLVVGTGTGTGTPSTVAATISGFQSGNSLMVTAAATGLTYTATSASTGILALLNDGTAIASFSFTGSYTAGSFVFSPTLSGGSQITSLAPQTGSGGTPSANADAYDWIGSTGGYWGVTTNWRNLTTGSNPAIAFPGTLSPVTIAGPAGPVYEVIRGGGSAASLTVTGNVDLNGFDLIGALSVGRKSVSGAGSTAVSYVYNGGALLVASVVAASTVNLVSGSLAVAGGSATLNTSGAVTAGTQSIVTTGLPASYDPGSAVNLSVSGGGSWNAGTTLAIVQGALSVSGVGSTASVTGAVSLGAAGRPPGGASSAAYDATGTIAVSGGGVFSTGDALTEIAGSITVSGAGSRLTVANVLTLGLAASAGSLGITNGGSARAGGLVLQTPATTNPDAAATAIPSILVDATGSLEIGSGTAATGSITIDAGRSVSATANANIAGTIVDNGVLSETGGSLTLTGNLSGSGTLQIGPRGMVAMNGAIAAGIGIAFTGTAATLSIGTNPAGGAPYGMGGTINGFQLGDSILFNAAATDIAYVATGANSGRLTLFNAGTPVAGLAFAGNYPAGFFFLSPTTAGGSSINLLAPQTGSGGASATNADVYTWIGASGGLWGFAANWRDLTSGASPASYIPGALTPVTVAGPAGLTYAAIGGGGSSASVIPPAWRSPATSRSAAPTAPAR